MTWRQLAVGKYVYRTSNDFLIFGAERNGRWFITRPIPFEIGEDISPREFLDEVTREDLRDFAQLLTVFAGFDSLAEARSAADRYIEYIEDTYTLKFARWWRQYPAAATRLQALIDAAGG